MSKLLPQNATKLEKNIEKLGEKISSLRVPFTELNRIDQCPVAHLPWLAWSHRVEYWQADWTEPEKRQAITDSKKFNEQRGTKASLHTLIATVVADFQLKAWHQLSPKAQPFTFIVIVAKTIFLTIDQLSQLHTAVDATKSQRDLYSIDANVITIGNFYIAGLPNVNQSTYLNSE